MLKQCLRGVECVRINHVMRNSQRDVLDIMREAHRFAQSIGAVDEETVFFFGSLNSRIHLDIHTV